MVCCISRRSAGADGAGCVFLVVEPLPGFAFLVIFYFGPY